MEAENIALNTSIALDR